MNIAVTLNSIRGESAGIPKLVLNFLAKNISDSNLAIFNVDAEVRVGPSLIEEDMSKVYFIGYGVFEDWSGQLNKGSEQPWAVNLALSADALRKIEEVRKAGDLFLKVLFRCMAARVPDGASPVTAPARASVSTPGYSSLYCPFKVAQSDWEKVLDQLGYRDAAGTEEEVARTLKRVQEIRQEIESILEKAKGAAGLVGAASHAIHFDAEASRHRKASLYWLTGTVVLACASIWYSLHSFHQTVGFPSQGSAAWWPHAAYMASRLLVLSVIFFGLAWCARNYRASKHNEVVNRHRLNALRTFETFAKAADDRDTRDAVLVQATKSIFDAQSSGYLIGEPEKVPSSTVVEVLRKAMSKED